MEEIQINNLMMPHKTPEKQEQLKCKVNIRKVSKKIGALINEIKPRMVL